MEHKFFITMKITSKTDKNVSYKTSLKYETNDLKEEVAKKFKKYEELCEKDPMSANVEIIEIEEV